MQNLVTEHLLLPGSELERPPLSGEGPGKVGIILP